MAANFRIHLLDMGNRDYGDCIVIEIGERTILIDGGHPGDERSRTGFRSLPRQMSSIFGTEPPFAFDLLVMTHCHNDHIGCLPEMIASGTVTAEWALLADPDLGWGISNDDSEDSPFDVDNPVQQRVLAGLREEPPLRLSNDELAEFLEDAARLQDRYRQMIEALDSAGTEVVRCGRDNIMELINEFQDVGLRYLGPTDTHLDLCTAVIVDIGRDSRDSVQDAMAGDAAPDAVRLYRSLVASGADAEDRPGMGAALNDQSIVLSLEIENKRALFTGDMQFAEPEVPGLDAEMRALRTRVANRAPYHFVKIAHHASYNAFDQSVLDELGESLSYGVSTGRGDPGHPAQSVLQILRNNREDIRWARTDRNGLVTFDLGNSSPRITCHRGTVNNTRINTDAVPEPTNQNVPPVETPRESTGSEPVAETSRSASGLSADRNFVEVTANVPHVSTRVTLTIQVEPGISAEVPSGQGALPTREPNTNLPAPPRSPRVVTTSNPVSDPASFQLGGGRTLPPLLFVTNRGKLLDNIGATAVSTIISRLSAAGHQVLHSTPLDIEGATTSVRQQLMQFPATRGVVIIGGYDVVPPMKLDTLDPGLRGQLTGLHSDSDDFIVWSDAIYGDNDGDEDQELPVSRIPDGRSAQLVLTALAASPPSSTQAFGIRNLRRPFAQDIWSQLGAGQIPSCAPLGVAQVNPAQLQAAGRLYFMLHGDDDDTTKFWGETAGGGYPEAFNISRVPPRTPAVLLTGCCWGALTATVSARRHVDGHPLATHNAETSLALRLLRGGAQAFVGCTGSHYSPIEPPYQYFGGPMHSAFWRNVLPAPSGLGMAPAAALFEAKKTYLAGMPHGQTAPNAQAIEMKIYHQFQCLGLGW